MRADPPPPGEDKKEAPVPRSNPFSPFARRDGLLRCAHNDVDMVSRSRGADSARVVLELSSPPKIRGRREGRVLAGTRGLVCNKRKKNAHEHPAFPAQWFDGLCRALPGDEFVLPPSPANWRLASPGWALQTSAGLTPATGARTTRFYRTQQRLRLARQRSLTENPPCDPHRAPALSRPSHPRPNVRDDRDTPLLRAGIRCVLGLICGAREGNSFFAQDWTGQISLKRLRNFLFARSARRVG
jgi:hypothetical protein